MMRTANPALTDGTFRSFGRVAESEQMTIQGTVNKTGILLGCVLAGAFFTWSLALKGSPAVGGLLVVGAIGGLIAALVTIFKKEWAAVSAPIYAVFEGLFLGGFSAMLEARYPGIVMQGVGMTFGTMFCLLGAYKSGMIKVTENFKLGIVAATGGLALVYFVSFILSLFGLPLTFLHGNGLISIGFSLVVVTIAALSLVMDFDFIEQGANSGAPKYMEWYGAFGLMVTLIWLYIEIVRLLAKLKDRD